MRSTAPGGVIHPSRPVVSFVPPSPCPTHTILPSLLLPNYVKRKICRSERSDSSTMSSTVTAEEVVDRCRKQTIGAYTPREERSEKAPQ